MLLYEQYKMRLLALPKLAQSVDLSECGVSRARVVPTPAQLQWKDVDEDALAQVPMWTRTASTRIE